MLDNLFVFDCESYPYDTFFVFKNAATNEYHVMHNDNEAVMGFMQTEPILVGYNNKHYDQFILKATLMDLEPQEIKRISDKLIVEEIPGWQLPELDDRSIYFNHFDLMDDTQLGTSLKDIEGHLGMNIVECPVPFDIDRPLTDEEVEEVIEYCKHDVDATHILLKLREIYIANKLTLGREKGLEPAKAVYMTNAKLTAAYLDAKAKTHNDEREYVYPDNLRKEYIPKEVFEFFDQMQDPRIPDKVLFNSKLTISLNGTPVVIGFGGIHSAIQYYKFVDRGC